MGLVPLERSFLEDYKFLIFSKNALSNYATAFPQFGGEMIFALLSNKMAPQDHFSWLISPEQLPGEKWDWSQ